MYKVLVLYVVVRVGPDDVVEATEMFERALREVRLEWENKYESNRTEEPCIVMIGAGWRWRRRRRRKCRDYLY